MSNGGITNLSFYTYLKSALKKTIFSETYLIFQLAKQFLKQIFRMHFLLRSNLHFLNRMKRQIFLIPQSPYLKKKVFNS
jgi:hypothetical protein